MLVDRYPPMDLFALVPPLLCAFEPVLRELDRLLDDEAIVRRVKADLAQRAAHSLRRGRPSTPVEVILRLLVVKRLYGWSYEEVEHFVADSLVLRQFCRIYGKRVPDDTTLLRWANCIAPATLAALNERVVLLARQLQVTRGRKLRLDSTVVATTIHHPSDSSLLADGVRVLSRLLRRAKTVLGETTKFGGAVFRTRLRSTRRLVQSLHRLGRRRSAAAQQAMRDAYARLIAVATQTQRQATRIYSALATRADAAAQRVAGRIATYLPRSAQVIRQATRRTLHGESVPAGEKIVSVFEPHTQIIVRNKAGKPVEFGRKLWRAEVEGGIISGWRVLDTPGSASAPASRGGSASSSAPVVWIDVAIMTRPVWVVGSVGALSLLISNVLPAPRRSGWWAAPSDRAVPMLRAASHSYDAPLRWSEISSSG